MAGMSWLPQGQGTSAGPPQGMDPARWQQMQQAMMALQQQPSSMPGANGGMYSSPDNLEGRGPNHGVAYTPAKDAMADIISGMQAQGRKSLNPSEIFNALPLLPMRMLENVVSDPLSMVRQGSELTGDVMSGKVDPMSGEGAQRAAELAFNAATGGQSKGTFAPNISPGIGIFGGIGAKTADPNKLKSAMSMEERGLPASEIWMRTGWGRGPEGKWRFEIPDTNARVNPEGSNFLNEKMPHDALYEAYPEFADIETHTGLAPEGQGRFHSIAGIQAAGPNEDEILSSLLHEAQHAVQLKEGFQNGSLPENHWVQQFAVMGGAKSHIPELKDKFTTVQDIAYQIYKRMAGEVEARNVQYRHDFNVPTDIPPWVTQDFPYEQQFAQKWGAPIQPLLSMIPRK